MTWGVANIGSQDGGQIFGDGDLMLLTIGLRAKPSLRIFGSAQINGMASPG